MTSLIAIPQSELDQMKSEIHNTNILVKELLEVIKSDERLKNETFLTTAEVTERYKISTASLYRRMNQKNISCVRSGRVVRWKQSVIEQHFSKRK